MARLGDLGKRRFQGRDQAFRIRGFELRRGGQGQADGNGRPFQFRRRGKKFHGKLVVTEFTGFEIHEYGKPQQKQGEPGEEQI